VIKLAFHDHAYYNSEIGPIRVEAENGKITLVEFDESRQKYNGEKSQKPGGAVLECVKQLDEYFRGKRKEFALDLRLQGTEFQQKVWKTLIDIPYGRTVSYGDIAHRIGKIGAARAVGNANSKNRFVVIVPCHRVIGSDAELVGYAKGLYRKEYLLKHEKKFL